MHIFTITYPHSHARTPEHTSIPPYTWTHIHMPKLSEYNLSNLIDISSVSLHKTRTFRWRDFGMLQFYHPLRNFVLEIRHNYRKILIESFILPFTYLSTHGVLPPFKDVAYPPTLIVSQCSLGSFWFAVRGITLNPTGFSFKFTGFTVYPWVS